MTTFGEGLSFLDYQYSTRKTAIYADEARALERREACDRIVAEELLGLLRFMESGAAGIDGCKKWIRDGKDPGGKLVLTLTERARNAKLRLDRQTENLQKLPLGQLYTLLGFLSEAGEIAALLQEFICGRIDAEALETRLKKEGGDALWYLSEISTEFGWPLATMASENLDKLASRQERGKLGGSGDER